MQVYKEDNSIEKNSHLILQEDKQFTDIFCFNTTELEERERITPDPVEVKKCIFYLTSEPPESFFYASMMVQYIFNEPKILYDLTCEQLMTFYAMTKELMFQRIGLTLLSLSYEVCDNITNFNAIAATDIFVIFKSLIEECDELEIYWNIMICIRYAAKSRNVEIQRQLVESGIIETLITVDHEGIEYQENKLKTVLALLQNEWLLDGFEIIEPLFGFVVSAYSSEYDIIRNYGIKMMEQCIIKNENKLKEFSENEELKWMLSNYFVAKNSSTRSNAVCMFNSIVSISNKECVAKIATIEFLNNFFTLIDAYSGEELKQSINIVNQIIEKLSSDVRIYIANSFKEIIMNKQLLEPSYKAKLIYAGILDSIMSHSDTQMTINLMSDEVLEFVVSIITSENKEYCYYGCKILQEAAAMDTVGELTDKINNAIESNNLIDIFVDIVDSSDNKDDIMISTIQDFVKQYNARFDESD